MPCLTGLVLLSPLKRAKNNVRGSARVEIHRETAPGTELAANHQHTLERASYYPNSNQRRIVSDVSLFRYVMILLAGISADSTNPVKVSSVNGKSGVAG